MPRAAVPVAVRHSCSGPRAVTALSRREPVPVTVLNGFLGAGKTTLLKSFLHQAAQAGHALRLAVIANDMSELDVDEEVIANSNLVSAGQGNLVSIASGSLASQRLLPQFQEAVARLLAQYQPSHILVETSGSTHPWPLIEALRNMPDVALHGFVTLVDGVGLEQDYRRGAAIADALTHSRAGGPRGVQDLLAEQIMFASRIVLTKIDRLPEGALQQMGHALHPLNPAADIVGARWGGVRLQDILAMPAYDHAHAAATVRRLGIAHVMTADGDIADPAAYRIGSRVLRDPRPFHPGRLWQAYNRFLGIGIHRSKGFFWLPSRDPLVLLWNQTAGSIGLEILGYWKIVALQDPALRMTREERGILEARLAGFPPAFGDRRCELTVIGQDDELDTFVAALHDCFCTADEIAAWQRGEAFEDPWPTRIARLRMGPGPAADAA